MTNLILLFITHFVADFLFQTREMAKNKSSNFIYLTAHSFIIFISFLWAGIEFAVFNALAHFVIDAYIWNAYTFLRRKSGPDFKYWEDSLFYNFIGFDQLLHGLTIIYLSRLVV